MTKTFLFACVGLALKLAPACAQVAQFDVNEQVNPARTNSVDFSGGFTLPLKQAWHAPINITYGSVPPLVANQMVYTLQNAPDGQYNLLVAMNLATGATAWTKEVGLGTVVYDKKTLFFVGYNGYVQAFAAGTGRPLWTTPYPSDFTLDARPVGYNGKLYVPLYQSNESNPSLVAFDEANGNVVWQQLFEFTTPGNAGPTIDAADNAVIYTASGYVASLDLATGAMNWVNDGFEATQCTGAQQFTSVFSRGIYAPGVECTYGFLLNAKTGAAIEPYTSYGEAFYGRLQITQPDTQTVAALDVATSSQIWAFRLPDAAFYTPLVVNGIVFDYASNGKLYALEAATGKRLQVVTPPLGNGELVYVYLAAAEGYLLVEAGNRLTVYKGSD